MRKTVLLVVLLSSVGCAPVRRTRLVIPTGCVGISVHSFTQPCMQQADGKFICNGVVITARCIAPSGRQGQNVKEHRAPGCGQ
jgi:hypothetical protein